MKGMAEKRNRCTGAGAGIREPVYLTKIKNKTLLCCLLICFMCYIIMSFYLLLKYDCEVTQNRGFEIVIWVVQRCITYWFFDFFLRFIYFHFGYEYFIHLYICDHVCAWSQKRVSNILDLGLEMVLSHLWVLGMEPESSEKQPVLLATELSLQPHHPSETRSSLCHPR